MSLRSSVGQAVRVSKRKQSGDSINETNDNNHLVQFECHEDVFHSPLRKESKRLTIGSATRMKLISQSQSSNNSSNHSNHSNHSTAKESITKSTLSTSKQSSSTSSRRSSSCNSITSNDGILTRSRSSSEGISTIHNNNNSSLSVQEVSCQAFLIVDETAKNRPWNVDDFSLGRALGKGKFGMVYFARQKYTQIPVALKVLFKTPMIAANSIYLLKREVEIQCRLKHPHIVNLYGYFHDLKNVYLILEYLPNGELFKILSKSGQNKVSEKICWKYIKDVSSAMSYMHFRHVIHRDLKPENLLIDDEGKLRIADFGWSIHAPPPLHNRRYTVCGTPEYVSPEMIINDGKNGHTYHVDLWAMGILMFELLYGRTPFHERNTEATITTDAIESTDFQLQSQLHSTAYDRTFQKIAAYDGVIDFSAYHGYINYDNNSSNGDANHNNSSSSSSRSSGSFNNSRNSSDNNTEYRSSGMNMNNSNNTHNTNGTITQPSKLILDTILSLLQPDPINRTSAEDTYKLCSQQLELE